MRARKLAALGAGLAAAAIALTGCASPAADANTDDGSGSGEQELRTVNVVAVPVVDVAALYVGTEQGFFAEEGLELNIEFGQGTAAMIPALLKGQYDIQYGGTPNLLQAVDAGMPLEAIALGDRSTGEDGADHGGVLVPEASGIASAKDLEGKTVAVNALKGLHEITVWQAVAQDGGDPSKINFVEMPFPDMGAAMASGQIDAAATSEPFIGVLASQGNRVMLSQFVQVDPDFVAAVYFAASDKIASDPELFASFVRALEKTYEYAEEHPEEIRAQLGNFTQIEEGLAESMILSRFTPVQLTREDLQVVADAAAAAGTIEDPKGAVERASAFLEAND